MTYTETRSSASGPGQPRGCVANVSLDVGKRTGTQLHCVARCFGNEGRTSCIRVPVIISEVMKTGMGERAAQPVTRPVLAFFECHDQVKNPIRHRALAHSDDPR